MKNFYFSLVLFSLASVSVWSCGSPPISPTSGGDAQSRVYEDKDWRFRLTIPNDSTWSWTSQTSYQYRASNGLPAFDLEISKVPLSGQSFRPTMSVEGYALPQNQTLATFVASLEENFKAGFLGYTAQPKSYIQVGSEDAVQWVFQASPLQGLGTQFLVTMVIHQRKAFLLLADGVSSYFPVDEFRQIVGTMQFF